MAADHETVERHALESGFGSLGDLLKQGGIPLRSVDLDVIQDGNEDSYWDRSERFDMVACLNLGQPLIDALCRVLERWIEHFTSASVRIVTAREIEDAHWVWHVGLDAEALGPGNDFYNGKRIDSDRHSRLQCLFVLNLSTASDMLQEATATHLALAKAMDKTGRRVSLFVQVNIGDEPQKGGCAIADLPPLLGEAQVADLPVIGLMCVPPAGIEAAPFFALLAKLADDHGLAGRSMGMSDDFETAVMLGATHIRVGSALFGARG